MGTSQTSGKNTARLIYDPYFVTYVGPWRVGDDGISNLITVDVYPQPDSYALGDDFFIWLTETSQQAQLPNDHYGIRKYE